MFERLGDVERPLMLVAVHKDQGQYELVLLIQSVQNFIACDRDSGAAFGSALDFDMREGGSLPSTARGKLVTSQPHFWADTSITS